MTTLYRAAIGPVNAERYLPRFARFDALGRVRPGWNWAACACTLNWMALRHLWGAALVYVAAAEGLALLVFGVGRPMLQWPDTVQWGLIAVFATLAFVLPGLYGDAVLHTEIRKRIARALAATRTIPEACAQLSRQASSWKRLIGLALLNLVLVGAASAAYWYLPQGSLTSDTPAAPPTLPVASEPAPVAATASAPASLSAPDPAPPPSPTAAPEAAASTPAPAESPASAAPEMAPEPPPAPPPVTPPPPQAAPQPPAKSPTPAQAQAASQAQAVRTVPRRPPEARASAPAMASAAASAAPSAAASASPPLPEVGKAPGFYINVGLFAEEANARRAQARLLNEGLPAFRQTLDTAKGPRIRVRVGPYPSAKEANAAAAHIRRLKLEAVVFKQ